jgi:Zn-dependent peptidase ImmA (M78 family)
MEKHGIVVAFAPLDVRSLYSYGDRVLGRPVVLSNARTGDRYESRFWLAHEPGHLLLHARGSRYRERGQKVLEDEASVFAAEFLTPESEMIAAAQHIRANGAGPCISQ